MVKLTRQEIEAFLGDDIPVPQRLKLESLMSFGWLFVACFTYSAVFVAIFIATAQIYGATLYINTATLPAEMAEAIPATNEILQIRSFIGMILLVGSGLTFLLRRGFLTMLLISLSYSINTLLQTWAFTRGLGIEHIPLAGLLIELGGVIFLIAMITAGLIYWSRRGRDIYLDF